jgi:hypothetical protein
MTLTKRPSSDVAFDVLFSALFAVLALTYILSGPYGIAGIVTGLVGYFGNCNTKTTGNVTDVTPLHTYGKCEIAYVYAAGERTYNGTAILKCGPGDNTSTTVPLCYGASHPSHHTLRVSENYISLEACHALFLSGGICLFLFAAVTTCMCWDHRTSHKCDRERYGGGGYVIPITVDPCTLGGAKPVAPVTPVPVPAPAAAGDGFTFYFNQRGLPIQPAGVGVLSQVN